MKTLLVTSQFSKNVLEYDASTGGFLKVAATGGTLTDPVSLAIGLDGNLLVVDAQTSELKRFDRTTGAFIDVFASTNLVHPVGITIHQGNLYVCNTNPPQGIQRFDAITGAHTGSFVTTLVNPRPNDVKVNPANGRLYVLYYNAATVEVLDPTSMSSLGLLMPEGNPIGSGGLRTPQAIAFGPDGNLYISGGLSPMGVRRYNPSTGAFIDLFVDTGSVAPTGIAFGPDQNLYVAIQNPSSVMRFNYPTGAPMGAFVPQGSGGLQAPFHLMFAAVRRPTLTYTLQQDCVNDVHDSAMSWQIEGGKVFEDGEHVADYSSVKRVSCATTAQHTAQVWMTLFFLGEKPPENMTLLGAHDFDSGTDIGSVSAASWAFSTYVGKHFKRVTNSLSIG
jgi:sugar lactone lactonase YvrE